MKTVRDVTRCSEDTIAKPMDIMEKAGKLDIFFYLDYPTN